MPRILHNPTDLMKLDRDSLDDILLEDYRNSALLRELFRNTLYQLKTQTELTEMYKEKCKKTLGSLNSLREEINDVVNKYE